MLEVQLLENWAALDEVLEVRPVRGTFVVGSCFVGISPGDLSPRGLLFLGHPSRPSQQPSLWLGPLLLFVCPCVIGPLLVLL